MGETKHDIFTLFQAESEPFEISDGDGHAVTLKLLKRTEAQRREASRHATQETKHFYTEREERLAILEPLHADTPKAMLIQGLLGLYAMRQVSEGLDLLDDIEPPEVDAPQTKEQLEEQRKKRAKEKLAEWKKELEAKTHEQVVTEIALNSWRGQTNMAEHEAILDVTLVQTCVDAQTGQPVFGGIDDLLGLPTEAVDELKLHLRRFMFGETEPGARENARDPNLSTPVE